MSKEPRDFSAIKNSISGKTISEMTWEEIFSLKGKRMTQPEFIQQIKETARKKQSE